MAGLLSKIQSLDLYRKIERDLTRGTTTGAVVSILGASLMVLLFLLEFRDYLSPEITTQIHLDQFEDTLLQVNLNVTVERVACPFLSIQLENVLGTHQGNLTRTIRKFKVTTKGNKKTTSTHSFSSHQNDIQVEELQTEQVIEDKIQLENEGGTKKEKGPFVGTMETLGSKLGEHEVVMVAFYAPWCLWSQKFLPLWSELADTVAQEFQGRVALGQTDCSGNKAQTGFCHAFHVSAFPAIFLFRNGEPTQYHGDRTAEGILEFIRIHLPKERDTQKNTKLVQTAKKHIEEQGVKAVEGCQISGYVLVKKVPGNLIVEAVSRKHTFDMSRVNMSHIVHHLSFGQLYLDEELDLLPPQVTESMRTIHEREYISTAANQTHEHYLKIIGSLYKYLDAGTLSSYKYTSHSATYHGHTRMPVIKFHYDISPINVVVTEQFKPFYQFLTSLFAIIGGTFTVFGLIDAFLYNAVRVVQRKNALGKLN